MASSARIDELRKKFDENPRRYFAPLANEYRKAGDLEQAIFICQEYLPQQPGHMSGHIVYGQALFELNRHEEARTVFETALSLDPENLIALRHLGDIARQAGDTDSARIWYQRVLEADPRNEEIAQIMLELLDAGGSRASAATAPAVDHSAPTPLSTPAVSSLAADIESDLAAEAPPAEPMIDAAAPAMFEVEKAGDTSIEIPAEPAPEMHVEVPAPPPATPAPAAPAPAKEEELLDLDGFDLGGVPLSDLKTPKPEAPPAAAEAPVFEDTSEAALEMPAEEPVAEQGGMMDEAFEADPFAIAAAPTTEPAAAPIPEPPQPEIEMATDLELGLPADSAPPPIPDVPAALGLETFEAGTLNQTPPAASMAIDTESFFEAPPVTQPEAEPEPEPEPEPAAPFVTETMATLYLQQGHLESALEIYQQLVAQRPDDADLRERLRAVEERLHGPPAPVVEAPSYGGPTIRDFLSGILSRRTPVSVQDVAASAPVEPEPVVETPPAEEPPEPDHSHDFVATAERRPTPSSIETVSGSLGVLFDGADATASDTAAANALAEAFQPDSPETAPLQGVPAHRASSELSLDHVFKGGTPPRPREGGDFSFDQFFAEDAVESAPSSDASSAAPAEGGDDIAQFNAWLNGLKKT